MSTAPSLSPIERSISTRLALVFALRMFGLFVVLPIFMPYANGLPLGNFPLIDLHSDHARAIAAGWAMGAYGLTQAILYIPYGIASDNFGRKRIITIGLLLFAAGALWAAYADNVFALACARALQGAGAISSVVVAMVGDTTRAEVRTRAMAMIGMSIALTFAISLIVAPLLFEVIGMSGIFIVIAILAVLSIGLVLSIPLQQNPASINSVASLKAVLVDAKQWRLNIGVFILHAVQMAMWVVLPQRLNDMNLGHSASAWLYFGVILVSMAIMIPLIIRAEKYGKMKLIMAISISLVCLAQVGLAINFGGVAGIAAALLLFFIGFNVLEATQPSLLSKLTHPATKGAAAGVYNTIQALGLFVGATGGAWLNAHFGALGLFLTAASFALVWLLMHLKSSTAT